MSQGIFYYKKEILENIPDLERFSIGYRLMCKFNFFIFGAM